jgi:hemoglobin/transferrin/lactoferrin receptor protein
LFYTFFYDAIVVDAFTFNGQTEMQYQGETTRIFANQNKRRAFITGFSTSLHANISPSFMADGSFTYTYGRIKDASGNIPLDHIPPSFGRVKIQYKHKRIASEIFSNFSGWKRIDDYLLNAEDNEAYAPAAGTPSWFTLNLRVAYELSRAFAIQTGVDNLLDLQYRTFSSGINAPGRNIFGTLKIRF